MNSISIVGRSVRDCNYKETTLQDAKLCKFVIADQSDQYTEGKPDTNFIPCIAWNKNADILVKYVKQGDLIAVFGTLRVRKYEVTEGEETKTKEAWEVLVDKIKLLSGKKEEEPKKEEPKELKQEDIDPNLPF